VIGPLIAFLLPASQDIVAFLTRRPRPWLGALCGLGLLAILIQLGDRNIHVFAYYQF
jgi:alginate O-acetyltransferase complex protein AlgI